MMSTLDERREVLEARIWELFPQLAKKKRPPNLVVGENNLGGGSVKQRFQDVSSQEAIAVFEKEPYWFTDIDYISCFPSKTFRYYLPPFLLALLHVPEQYPAYSLRWFWDDLYGERDGFTHEQDTILIAIFEWMDDFERSIVPGGLSFGYSGELTFETCALKSMLIVDKKKVELGQKYLR